MIKPEQYKIEIDGLYYLVVAVQTEYIISGKVSPYENLLSQVSTYQRNGTNFDPKLHKIDDFMVDAYKIYYKYLDVEDKLDEIIGDVDDGSLIGGFLGSFDSDMIKQEFKKIILTFEEIILNCEFENAQIRGIQKNFLISKMNNVASEENYELAAKLRDKIKKI
jgi:hypothetical protein